MANQSTDQDANSVSLRELVERVLQTRYPYDPEAPEEVQVLPGVVPESFPAEIPLPEGCRVVGSVMLRGTMASRTQPWPAPESHPTAADTSGRLNRGIPWMSPRSMGVQYPGITHNRVKDVALS
jgi:hypothetical protein